MQWNKHLDRKRLHTCGHQETAECAIHVSHVEMLLRYLAFDDLYAYADLVVIAVVVRLTTAFARNLRLKSLCWIMTVTGYRFSVKSGVIIVRSTSN